MLLKNIFYAILLGVGMAACLSQNDKQKEEGTATSVIEENATETSAPPVAPSPEQLAIGPNKVGFVTIGQDIKQMRQNIPTGFAITDTTLQQEGMQATAYIIRPEQQAKGFLVEQQCDQDCKVWRLNVKSEEYKTPKGIHVGSTYAQAQKA